MSAAGIIASRRRASVILQRPPRVGHAPAAAAEPPVRGEFAPRPPPAAFGFSAVARAVSPVTFEHPAAPFPAESAMPAPSGAAGGGHATEPCGAFGVFEASSTLVNEEPAVAPATMTDVTSRSMTDAANGVSEQPQPSDESAAPTTTSTNGGSDETGCLATARQFLDRWKRYSLFLLPEGHPVRSSMTMVSNHNVFNGFILVCIVLNSIGLAMSQPAVTNPPVMDLVLNVAEYFFTAVFAVELIVKVLAMGFVLHPGAYLRNVWNVLDCLIVLTSVASAIADVVGAIRGGGAGSSSVTGGFNFSALRVFRVLRPLRSLNRVKKLRDLISTIVFALPAVASNLLLFAFVLVVTSITGVQMWAGKLNQRCYITDFDARDAWREARGEELERSRTAAPFTAFPRATVDDRPPTRGRARRYYSSFSTNNDANASSAGGNSSNASPLLSTQLLLPSSGGDLDDSTYFPLRNANLSYVNLSTPFLIRNDEHNCGGAYDCPSLLASYGYNSTCMANRRLFYTRNLNFDNTVSGALLALKMIVKDNWQDDLENLMNSAGASAAFYLIALTFFGSIVVNLFVAILTRSYQDAESFAEPVAIAIQARADDIDAALAKLEEDQEHDDDDDDEEGDVAADGLADNFTGIKATGNSMLRVTLPPVPDGLPADEGEPPALLLPSQATGAGTASLRRRRVSREDLQTSNDLMLQVMLEASAMRTRDVTEVMLGVAGGHEISIEGHPAAASALDSDDPFAVSAAALAHSNVTETKMAPVSEVAPSSADERGDEPSQPVAPDAMAPDPSTATQPPVLTSKGSSRRRVVVIDGDEVASAAVTPRRQKCGTEDAANRGAADGGGGPLNRSPTSRKSSGAGENLDESYLSSASSQDDDTNSFISSDDRSDDTVSDVDAGTAASQSSSSSLRAVGVDGDTASAIRRRARRRRRQRDTRARWRKTLAKVMNSIGVQVFLVIVTVANVATLAVDYYGITPDIVFATDIVSYTCTGLFTLNLLIVLLANGFRRTFRDGYQVADLIMILLAIPEMVLPGSSFDWVSAFRILRLIRFAKLLRIKSIQPIVTTVIDSVASMGYLAMLLLLFMYIFAVLGMQIFGVSFGSTVVENVDPRDTFGTIWQSLLTTFIVISGDDWTYRMRVGMAGYSGGGEIVPVLYFCSLYLLGNTILINLSVAIIMDKLTEKLDHLEQSAANPPLLLLPRIRETHEDFDASRRRKEAADRASMLNASSIGLLRSSRNGVSASGSVGEILNDMARRESLAMLRQAIRHRDGGGATTSAVEESGNVASRQGGTRRSRSAERRPQTAAEVQLLHRLAIDVSVTLRETIMMRRRQREEAERNNIGIDQSRRLLGLSVNAASFRTPHPSSQQHRGGGQGVIAATTMPPPAPRSISAPISRRSPAGSDLQPLDRNGHGSHRRDQGLAAAPIAQPIAAPTPAGAPPPKAKAAFIDELPDGRRKSVWRRIWAVVSYVETIELRGRSFLIFSPRNRFRVILANICASWAYERLIDVVILANLAVLVLDSPLNSPRTKEILRRVDIFFTSFFAAEMIMKTIAFGVFAPAPERGVSSEDNNDGDEEADGGDEEGSKRKASSRTTSCSACAARFLTALGFRLKRKSRRVSVRRGSVVEMSAAKNNDNVVGLGEDPAMNAQLQDEPEEDVNVIGPRRVESNRGEWSAAPVIRRTGYLRDPWNFVDFVVVVFSIAALFIPVFRTARSLRSVRLMTRHEQTKIIIIAIVEALPYVMQGLILVAFLFFVFGVIGVRLLKGKFYGCTDPNINTKAECVGNGTVTQVGPVAPEMVLQSRQWMRSAFHFDHLGAACFTLFFIIVADNWSNIMYQGMDTKSDEEIQPDGAPYMAIYFIAVYVCCSFFALNMMIGVLVNYFAKQKRIHDGSAFLTPEQRRYVRARFAIEATLSSENAPRDTPMAKRVHAFLSHKVAKLSEETSLFEMAIMLVIFVNAALLASAHDEMPAVLDRTIDLVGNVSLGFFILEMLLKLFAYGVEQYFSSGWNLFDAIVILSGIVALFTGSVGGLSALRVIRIFKLVKGTGVDSLLKSLARSLASITNIVALLVLTFFVFAVAGVVLFGELPYRGAIGPNRNFQTVWGGLLVLYQVATLEGWQDVMLSCVYEAPECPSDAKNCVRYEIAVIYFVSYVIICGFIVLQLFVAVVIEILMDDTATEDTEVLAFGQLKERWVEIFGTDQLVPVYKFYDFLPLIPSELSDIDPAVSTRVAWIVLLNALNVPIDSQFRVNFRDVINSIAFRKYRVDVRSMSKFVNDALSSLLTHNAFTASQTVCAMLIQRRWKEKREERMLRRRDPPKPVSVAIWLQDAERKQQDRKRRKMEASSMMTEGPAGSPGKSPSLSHWASSPLEDATTPTSGVSPAGADCSLRTLAATHRGIGVPTDGDTTTAQQGANRKSKGVASPVKDACLKRIHASGSSNSLDEARLQQLLDQWETTRLSSAHAVATAYVHPKDPLKNYFSHVPCQIALPVGASEDVMAAAATRAVCALQMNPNPVMLFDLPQAPTRRTPQDTQLESSTVSSEASRSSQLHPTAEVVPGLTAFSAVLPTAQVSIAPVTMDHAASARREAAALTATALGSNVFELLDRSQNSGSEGDDDGDGADMGTMVSGGMYSTVHSSSGCEKSRHTAAMSFSGMDRLSVSTVRRSPRAAGLPAVPSSGAAAGDMGHDVPGEHLDGQPPAAGLDDLFTAPVPLPSRGKVRRISV